MTQSSLVQIIEGALLAAGRPLTVAQLAELFEEHEKPTTDELREALDTVAGNCEGRGFELKQVASGYRFQVRESLSQWIGRLWHERPQKYSRALLETLSLIAYRQPITRGEIEEIRGVAVSSNIIKTLQEREWVRVVGHRDVPGRPAMYATTRGFLDYFNLRHLDQLPALAEIRDLETLNAELGFGPLPEAGAADAGQSAAPEAGQPDAMAAGEAADPVPADNTQEADNAQGVQEDDAPATENAPVDDDGNTTLDADEQSRQVPDHG